MTLFTFHPPKQKTRHKWFAWYPVHAVAHDWFKSGVSMVIWLDYVWREPSGSDGWWIVQIGGNNVQGQ